MTFPLLWCYSIWGYESARCNYLFMEKEKFVHNFKELLGQLRYVTRLYCNNRLSDNYKFILDPNITGNEYIPAWINFRSKWASFERVVDLLYKDGKVPMWADCNIYYSTDKVTVVRIVSSHQFKDEDEIYYLERGTGPFKALVSLPPYFKEGTKFDVNWKKTLDDQRRPGICATVSRCISKIFK